MIAARFTLAILLYCSVLAAAGQQGPIERDWRMQDGIGTPREPSSYEAAIGLALRRGDKLVRHLQANG
ncbi:hypothetical protein HQ576_13285, partial [bacterium]|nr:hypothetical protein [bacterium]